MIARCRADTRARRAILGLVAFALAATLPSTAFGQTVNRGPYLQRTTPTSVVVRWRTTTSTQSVVRFGAALGNLGSIADVPGNRTEHEVEVSGLPSDTKFFYSVGNTGGPLAGGNTDHFFVTAPSTGTAKSTRIWVLGDPGTGGRGASGAASARSVKDAYLNFTGTRGTDLWLMLGDNAYNDGTDNEYQNAVFNIYQEVLPNAPLWATLGNHDARSANSSDQSGVYYNVFTLPKEAEAGGLRSGTEAYYSFNYGNIHFVCLDSQETSRSPTGTMLTWLENDLADNILPWTIAFWHHPPYSKGSHDSDSEGRMIDMRENALPILEAGGVDLMLSGHSHSYERSFLVDSHYGSSGTLVSSMVVDGGNGRPAGDGAYEKSAGPSANEGTVYAVPGSSGQTSGVGNHPIMVVSLNVLGSMILDVNGDRMDATFLQSNGNVRDTFTIMKGSGLPPVLSAIAAVDVTDSSARITWSTDKAADSLVDFGLTTAYGMQVSDATQTMSHSLAITGLLPSTTYHFRVTSTDGGGQSVSSGDFTFVTLEQNDPPIALADNATTNEDVAVVINVLANDSDPNGDALSLESLGQPANGIVTINVDQSVTYTPSLDFNGSDSFTYVVGDTGGESSTGTVSVTVLAVNDSPVAQSQTASTIIDTPVPIALGAIDADGDVLTFAVVAGPTSGTLSGSAPNVIYTPNAGFLGADSFTFQADDGLAASNAATVSINVQPPGCLDCIDWSTTATVSYSNQDIAANAVVQDGGTGIRLLDNTWRRTTQTFAITPDTVLEFEFSSSVQGEIHAIGFDENDSLNDNARLFNFWGTQNWTGGGRIVFTPRYTGSGDFESFSIPVGQFYTGASMFLVLANDNNGGTGNNGHFRDVRVFERTPEPVALTTSTVGNGSVDPFGGDFAPGTVVSMTATPAAGWEFVGWSGDLSGSANPSPLTMDSAKIVTANFRLIPPQFSLTVSTVGQGSVSPAGGSFDEGTAVSLTATPAAGWQFDGWSGDLTGSVNPSSLTMDANKSVTATFSEVVVPQFTLTVSTVGQGSVSPVGGSFDEGTVVSLTATPAAGWQFDGWSGDLTGSVNPSSLAMDANKSVTATFSEVVLGTEDILTANNFGGDKIEVNQGQTGAQSFRVGAAGDPDFFITRAEIYLSRDQQAPNRDLTVTLGTSANGGTFAGSTVTITAAEVTNTSEGGSFDTFNVVFNSAIGPLQAGTTYFLSFEAESPNGSKYYLELDPNENYPQGNYFKAGGSDSKDLRFQIWGF